MRLRTPDWVTAISIGLAALIPQGPAEIRDVMPMWALVAIASVVATVSVLEKFGKLPGGLGFAAEDRRRIRELHGTLLYTRDDGVTRYVYHGKLLEELAKAEARRDGQAAKFDRTVGMLVDQLRTTNRQLKELKEGG